MNLTLKKPFDAPGFQNPWNLREGLQREAAHCASTAVDGVNLNNFSGSETLASEGEFNS